MKLLFNLTITNSKWNFSRFENIQHVPKVLKSNFNFLSNLSYGSTSVTILRKNKLRNCDTWICNVWCRFTDILCDFGVVIFVFLNTWVGNFWFFFELHVSKLIYGIPIQFSNDLAKELQINYDTFSASVLIYCFLKIIKRR